jgi:hypothetical protein
MLFPIQAANAGESPAIATAEGDRASYQPTFYQPTFYQLSISPLTERFRSFSRYRPPMPENLPLPRPPKARRLSISFLSAHFLSVLASRATSYQFLLPISGQFGRESDRN